MQSEFKKLKKEIKDFIYKIAKKKYGEEIAKNIKTKLQNINGKTGQYYVPKELFQKRTSRSNRVIIPWKDVKDNNLTLEHLETFKGGVVVEFVNNDYWNENEKNNELFNELKSKLGSDESVSSMISIRNEDGVSASNKQREAFKKLNQENFYKKGNFIRRKTNISKDVNKGNDKIEGFIFVSIKGGQQDTIESHKGKEEKIFNPACEYASEKVVDDIEMVLNYFVLKSINENILSEEEKKDLQSLLDNSKKYLEERIYNVIDLKKNKPIFKGSLWDYVSNHPSLSFSDGKFLIDPIQVERIDLEDFGIPDKGNLKNIDLSHDEAVNKNRFYWDKENEQILSPTNPINVFWQRHYSNMLQQNFTLEEFFEKERERVKKREKILKKRK